VYELQHENSNSSTAGSQGFSSDLMTYNNLGIGTNPQPPSSDKSERNIMSFIGRAQYSFHGKYMFNVAGRYDGSSVFGANNKWAFFPSTALAWRISQEEFMKDIAALSDLKLRLSYGVTGNQGVSAYSSLSRLNTTRQYAMDGSPQTGVGLGSIANPDLKWEKTTQYNVGFDYGLFKNRITGSIEIYYKETNDLLMSVPLPRISGYSTVLRNIGSVENKGLEFMIRGNPITGPLRWNTNFNFSLNRNKVLALSGENEIAVGTTGFPTFGNTIFLVVGEPIGVLKGYIQDGIWSTAEEEEAKKYGSIPGAPKYRDVSGPDGVPDGRITSADITKMGNTYPKFTIGFTNNFEYKNFDLNIFFQGSFGNDVYNLTRIRSERHSGDGDATQRRILNRWTPENQNTDVPSFTGSNSYEYIQSSRWLEDGSYLRLKTITLGYSLPKDLLGKLKISTLRVYVTGGNLLTFTDYSGYDPESSTSSGTSGGIDMAPYPAQKTYTVGINLGF